MRRVVPGLLGGKSQVGHCVAHSRRGWSLENSFCRATTHRIRRGNLGANLEMVSRDTIEPRQK
eukprot:COSAG04_NODE_2835_length_3512_cov_1.795781_5_plen_63_part_00